MTTPPGYYLDSQGVMRWWTGQGWTQHVQPPPAVRPPKAVYVSGLTTGAHIRHGVLTAVTLGLWAPIWLLAWWLGRRRIR